MIITTCGSCGGTHYGIDTIKLQEKVKRDKLTYSHYFVCPVTRREVLLRFKDRKRR